MNVVIRVPDDIIIVEHFSVLVLGGLPSDIADRIARAAYHLHCIEFCELELRRRARRAITSTYSSGLFGITLRDALILDSNND